MDLTKVRLQQITDEEYAKLRRFWEPNPKEGHPHHPIKTQIITPLTSPDYETLLDEFFANPYSQRASLLKDGSWTNYYTKRPGDKELALTFPTQLQETSNPPPLLQLGFKFPHSFKRTVIHFHQQAGQQIIGFKTGFYSHPQHPFKWDNQPNAELTLVHGFWVPEEAAAQHTKLDA